jgi:hypothetical protein
VLLAIDSDEYFIDLKGIAIAPVLLLQSAGINGTEFDAPQANRFSADGDASFGEQVFYISVAEVEAIIEPHGIGNDIWRGSMALIGIHGPILSSSAI